MTDERLIATTAEAAWLPPGSVAEVWAGDDCRVAVPAIVARLLLTRVSPEGVQEFFSVPTPRGPDLPSNYFWADGAGPSVSDGVTHLMREVFGRSDLPTRCVGFVRNVVPKPDAGYAYPSPWAHVPVFLIAHTAEAVVEGQWFSVDTGRDVVSERHWWRIVEHHLSPRDR